MRLIEASLDLWVRPSDLVYCIFTADVMWSIWTYSPLYGHQFAGLVASPHQHAAVGAVTQLLQGGVAVHRLSGRSHQPPRLNLFAKPSFRLSGATHRWNIFPFTASSACWWCVFLKRFRSSRSVEWPCSERRRRSTTFTSRTTSVSAHLSTRRVFSRWLLTESTREVPLALGERD